MVTKSKRDQYLVQRYIFIAVCLWERGRSHLVPRLDGQNMFLDPRRQIPRSPEERDSQRFERQENGGLEEFSSEAKRDKSELISRLTSLNICMRGCWSFDRQIYLDRKARWALQAGAEESRTMRRRPRRTGRALGAFILFCSMEAGGETAYIQGVVQ